MTFGPYQITIEYSLFGHRERHVFTRDSLGKMKTAFAVWSTCHGEKPPILYAHVNRRFDGPHRDGFVRRRYLGLESWGNQVKVAA